MQEVQTNSASAPYAQPWSDAELELLRRFLTDTASRRAITELFPGRTLCAVRSKLAELRRAAGTGGHRARRPNVPYDAETTMLDPNDPGRSDNWPARWAKGAARSNQQFLAALMAAA